MHSHRSLGRLAILVAGVAAVASADPNYHPSWETTTTLAPSIAELSTDAPELAGTLLLTIAGDELLEERLRWADEQDVGDRSGFALVDMVVGLLAVDGAQAGADVALELISGDTGEVFPPANLTMGPGEASSSALGIMLDPTVESLESCFDAPSICTLSWDIVLSLQPDSDPALVQWDVAAIVLGRGAASDQASVQLLFEPVI